MESNTKMKAIRFPETLPRDGKALFNIKGTLAGKDVFIYISPAEDANYITPKIANRLVIRESNITEKLDVQFIFILNPPTLNKPEIWSEINKQYDLWQKGVLTKENVNKEVLVYYILKKNFKPDPNKYSLRNFVCSLLEV